MTRVTYYSFCHANDGSINKNWQIRVRKTNYFEEVLVILYSLFLFVQESMVK